MPEAPSLQDGHRLSSASSSVAASAGTVDEEEYRLQQGRAVNKGEAAHDFSRFLFFGKEGAVLGRGFEDPARRSCGRSAAR